MPKEKYIPPEKQQQIFVELPLFWSKTYMVQMEYHKITNLLDNTDEQSPKFGTKSWVVVNDGVTGIRSLNSQIEFKTTMLKLGLCD